MCVWGWGVGGPVLKHLCNRQANGWTDQLQQCSFKDNIMKIYLFTWTPDDEDSLYSLFCSFLFFLPIIFDSVFTNDSMSLKKRINMDINQRLQTSTITRYFLCPGSGKVVSGHSTVHVCIFSDVDLRFSSKFQFAI